jgi:hypothetical protein
VRIRRGYRRSAGYHAAGKVLRLGLVAVLVTAVAAVVSPGRSQKRNDEILVTRDSVSLPAGCSPRQVATLLQRFTAAFNRGDRAALRRFFPLEDPMGPFSEPAGTVFRWYSVSEGTGRGVAFYDLDDLFAYFVRRHLQGERLTLLSVDVGIGRTRTAGIGYALRREASDLPPTLGAFVHGKSEVDCRGQRIYVWSMGHDDAPDPSVACPKPAKWTPSGPVLACSRSGSAPNAQEVAAAFVLDATQVRLPKRCRPPAVRARVESMLRSFNLGDGDRFARGFTPAGQFHPYTASIHGTGFIGRPKIAGFVRARYEAGDGWTATALHPPRSALPWKAVYGVRLRVSHQMVAVAEQGAKLVVDCRSGLLRGWIGPAVKQPG